MRMESLRFGEYRRVSGGEEEDSTHQIVHKSEARAGTLPESRQVNLPDDVSAVPTLSRV